MAKITKATFKSMIRKNQGNLYIKRSTRFDGMVDGIVHEGNGSYTPLLKDEHGHGNSLGYKGIWLVGGSCDYFTEVNENGYKGIHVSNCCGSFTVAVK